MRHLLLSLLLFAGAANAAVVEKYGFDSDDKRQMFRELLEELRCPKCQNQNIADSDASIARDLKDKVYVLVKQGKSKDEIIQYMKSRYGYFVHYQPPFNAATIILWLGPLVMIGGGFLFIYTSSRRKAKQIKIDTSEIEALLDQEKK